MHGMEVCEALECFPTHECNLLLTQRTRNVINVLQFHKGCILISDLFDKLGPPGDFLLHSTPYKSTACLSANMSQSRPRCWNADNPEKLSLTTGKDREYLNSNKTAWLSSKTMQHSLQSTWNMKKCCRCMKFYVVVLTGARSSLALSTQRMSNAMSMWSGVRTRQHI